MLSSPRTPLERRRRASARAALYLSLVLVVGLVVALLAWLRPSVIAGGESMEWRGEDFSGRPEVQLLRDYIAIDTSTPDGDQLAGAQWVAGQLFGMGLVPVVERVGDEANVWAILEGERREAVVLLSHIDVDAVPDRSIWRSAPFTATIDGPWLYGRGAFDMKSVAVAQLQALRSLLLSGVRPRMSVILVATTGEESGSELGTRWLLRQHPELVERFAVVLTEGGAVEGTRPGEAKYWGTEVAQARLVRVVVCGTSREALEALERNDRQLALRAEPRLTPEVRRVLADYAPTRDSPRLRRLLGEPEALLRDRPTYLELPPYLRTWFENVAVSTGVQAVAGGGYEWRLTLLLLPGSDVDAAVAELVPPWLVHGFETRVIDEGAASDGSSPDDWAFHALDQELTSHHPDFVHGPLYLPGTLTDARFLRRAGVPTYGFTPFNVLTPEVLSLRRYETPNERIALPGFVTGVELYADVLIRLAAGPG